MITEQEKTVAQKTVENIDLLIEQKYMIVDTVNYHVSMLDNLWSKYKGEMQLTFCKNLVFYCDIQNAYHGKKVKKNQNLLISLKNKKNDVHPAFVYYRIHELKKLKKKVM